MKLVNYRLSWKIILKNKWISLLYTAVLLAMFYEPAKTIYNAMTNSPNLSLSEINYSFMHQCIIWFSVMLFTTHELISHVRDKASQILWIGSKTEFYRNVFRFSIINDAIVSGLILVVQIALFVYGGKGIMGFLLKITLDIFFYYFLVGVIAIFTAMLISGVTAVCATDFSPCTP
ncbi:MAG: hypothetical protein ACI39R_06620 [Lachnospiraceae bacterium]